ncbi:hypothetical protein ABBQ32_001838 [Trebouxia sp. C0010 RCD-2024]
MAIGQVKDRHFGPYSVDSSQSFAETNLSFAFVNIKPVVSGHVLVSPERIVKSFEELSAEEVADLWLLVQKVAKVIKPFFKAESLTFAVQDGPAAGQSVPHLHVHVLPRKAGDFANNDEIYDAIDDKSNAYRPQNSAGEKLDMEAERRLRSADEMSAEATQLRQAMAELMQ